MVSTPPKILGYVTELLRKDRLYYLASPYTHESPAVMQQRYDEVYALAGALTVLGYHIYSPIVHFHQMAQDFNLPKDATFWKGLNHNVLKRCDCLLGAKIEGWRQSHGMRYEHETALVHELPILYISPLTLNITMELSDAYTCI